MYASLGLNESNQLWNYCGRSTTLFGLQIHSLYTWTPTFHRYVSCLEETMLGSRAIFCYEDHCVWYNDTHCKDKTDIRYVKWLLYFETASECVETKPQFRLQNQVCHIKNLVSSSHKALHCHPCLVRDHFMYGLSQWEEAFHSKTSSHRLSSYPEWSLLICLI